MEATLADTWKERVGAWENPRAVLPVWQVWKSRMRAIATHRAWQFLGTAKSPFSALSGAIAIAGER